MEIKPKQMSKERRELRNFLEKVVIDAGVGRLSQTPNFEEKALVQVMKDIADMTGQQPQIRRATKSIAGFKTAKARSSASGSRSAARIWLIFSSV